MKKKAIIFDLDNTIYSAPSIGNELFASLFELISHSDLHHQNLDQIKEDIMRKPFQVVAKEHHFSADLTAQGVALLKELTYDGKIEPFPDYHITKNIKADKYLVTTGFKKLQKSKVAGMKIGSDFKEIHIVDPSTSEQTKRDVFADIIRRHDYSKAEVLVIGDDLHSEIRAAQDLGIEAILYDRENRYAEPATIRKISNYNELQSLLI